MGGNRTAVRMQRRRLGKSDLEVPAIGLGRMGMSWSYGPPKDNQDVSIAAYLLTPLTGRGC
jgi:aryl-alcohol dehydrogenase-like predicted oxidoreductase